MIGEVRVVDDVAETFATIVAEHLSATDGPFVLGCSGGASGARCFTALAAQPLAWDRLELLFVDERCVPWESTDANGAVLAEVFRDHLGEVRGFHRMSCDEGPEAYERLLAHIGGIDLIQLGLGPDGHTASIFPGSPLLEHPPAALVARAEDPTGRNPHPRMTLTLAGIATAARRIVTVVGADKAEAFAAIVGGENLPGRYVDGPATLWLVDRAAVGAGGTAG